MARGFLSELATVAWLQLNSMNPRDLVCALGASKSRIRTNPHQSELLEPPVQAPFSFLWKKQVHHVETMGEAIVGIYRGVIGNRYKTEDFAPVSLGPGDFAALGGFRGPDHVANFVELTLSSLSFPPAEKDGDRDRSNVENIYIYNIYIYNMIHLYLHIYIYIYIYMSVCVSTLRTFQFQLQLHSLMGQRSFSVCDNDPSACVF